MSIKVMDYIFENSKQKNSARLLLLAIADSANDEGYAYPSIPTLAKKILVGERRVQQLIAQVEEAGELVVYERKGDSNLSDNYSNLYWIPMPNKGEKMPDVRGKISPRPAPALRKKPKQDEMPGEEYFTTPDENSDTTPSEEYFTTPDEENFTPGSDQEITPLVIMSAPESLFDPLLPVPLGTNPSVVVGNPRTTFLKQATTARMRSFQGRRAARSKLSSAQPNPDPQIPLPSSAAQIDLDADSLWLAFQARWKECTGTEIEVPPKLEASYRDSAWRMHQKGVTEDQVRRLVDQWIGEGKFHFLFNFAADRIDPILSADGVAARQRGAARGEPNAPSIPSQRETNGATKPQPTTRVNTILKSDWLPEKPLTAATAWEIAYSQMELQFDANTFGTFLRHAQLMDYEPESRTYVVTVHDDWAVETCQRRLYRSLRRIVSDADFMQDSEIKFLSQKNWSRQSLGEWSAVGD